MLHLNVCHNNIYLLRYLLTNLGTVLLTAVQKPPASTYPSRYLPRYVLMTLFEALICTLTI